MSASQSAPAASDLHESIDQVLAEAEKRGRAAAAAENQRLTDALQAALEEIKNSHHALGRAADALRAALGDNLTRPAAESRVEAAPDESSLIKEEPPVPPNGAPEANTTPDRGEHELDVIAHHASISTASGLQAMLRAQSEVKSAQTREFVNGELRLQLHLRNDLDMATLASWLDKHGGTLATQTDSVIEIRFAR